MDRDFLELNNLQRQVLYDEQDVADGLPKAVAAAAKLRRINSSVTVEPVVADVTYRNIAELAGDVDVIVDGTDNFATRMLINDYAVEQQKPWVYGGCIGAEGQTMTILPGETACLACLMPDVPPPGTTPTCDTAGVLGSIVGVVASIEACEALKILSGHREAVSRRLTIIDLWENEMRRVDLARLRESGDCRVCWHREFAWLSGEKGGGQAVLCGRNAVQIGAAEGTAVSLDELAATAGRRGPSGAESVPAAAGGRRLRADRVSRWPDDRRRDRRCGHRADGACTVCRGVIALARMSGFTGVAQVDAAVWQPVRAGGRRIDFRRWHNRFNPQTGSRRTSLIHRRGGR